MTSAEIKQSDRVRPSTAQGLAESTESVRQTTTPETAQVRRALLVFYAPGAIFLSLFAFVIAPVGSGAVSQSQVVLGGLMALILTISYLIGRGRHFALASLLTVGTISGMALAAASLYPDRANLFAVAAFLNASVMLGSLSLSPTNTVTLATLNVAGMFLLPLVRPDTTFELVFAPLLLNVILYTLILAITSIRQQDLEQTLHRTSQLHATAVVSQTAAMASDLNTLMRETVESISDIFGFYHVQIFLLDQLQELALLRAGTGEIGRQLLTRAHRLPVGSQSVVGQATVRAEPVVVQDVTMDPIHRRNDLLPNTRAELALPLQIGSQVIGALDVQSVEPNAFSFDDIEVLQVMANQLAIAIENVRLIDELSARADENEQLFAEAQASLQEIEALNRLLTRQGWQEYLRSRVRGGGLGYTLRAGDVMQDWHWSAGMQSAYQEQRVVVKGSEERPDSISLPLRVRGEVIGVVEVERDEDRIWTEEDVELVQALIERLSLALDNARLLEQADSLARREQLMNEISQNVQQAEDVDTLLQSALVELGRVLGASKGVVQLSPRGQTGQVFHTQSGDENGAPAGSDGSTSEEGQA